MKFKVIVKPNSNKTEIQEFDKNNNTYKIAISAPADKNKANKELIRFLSRYFRKKAVIKSGLTNKEKIIELID